MLSKFDVFIFFKSSHPPNSARPAGFSSFPILLIDILAFVVPTRSVVTPLLALLPLLLPFLLLLKPAAKPIIKISRQQQHNEINRHFFVTGNL